MRHGQRERNAALVGTRARRHAMAWRRGPGTPRARCVPPLPSTALARSVPPLLDPLPRRGRGIRKRGCATPVPAAMQWPRAGVTSRRRTPHCRHSRARCSFLSPSPLGGRGEGEGGRWRHLEPLGTSPLSLRLRLRSAQDGPLPPLCATGKMGNTLDRQDR